MEQASIGDGQGGDGYRDRGQKRPPRSSLFDIEDDRDAKMARPADDFTVRGRESSRDPRRRAVVHRASDLIPLSVPAFSESSPPHADNDESALATPYIDIHPDRRERMREREPEYPLSPRSKSPDGYEGKEMNERERPRHKASRPKYDSYKPTPSEVHRPDDPLSRDRGSEYIRSDTRIDPLTPRTSVSSSTRKPSSDSLAMPNTFQELSQFADAVARHATLTVQKHLKDEELRRYENMNKRFARHKKAFQSVAENMDCAGDEVAKSANYLGDQQVKSNNSLIELTRNLATKLQRSELAHGPASSKADTVSREEFMELKQELRTTKTALHDAQETLSSLSRHAIMERNLDKRGFVTREQVRKIIVDGNVPLEGQVASLATDFSRHRDHDTREKKQFKDTLAELHSFQTEQSKRDNTQRAAAEELSTMVFGKLDDHVKNMEEFKSSVAKDQRSKIQGFEDDQLQHYSNTASELQRLIGTLHAEMQELKAAQAETAHAQAAQAEAAQTAAAQTAAAQAEATQAKATEPQATQAHETRPEGTHASVNASLSNMSESEIGSMIKVIIDQEMSVQTELQEKSEDTLFGLTGDLEKKVADVVQQQGNLNALNNQIPGLKADIDRIIDSDSWQTQAIATLQHSTLQQSRQPVIPSQPLTPPTTNLDLSNLNVKIEALDRKLLQLGTQQNQMQTFVRSQQQKFDSLTSTQLVQSMVDHMRKVYPYHPANVIGQIQNLNKCLMQLDAASKQHTLKLHTLDVPAITRFISDFPSCAQQSTDALRHVSTIQAHLEGLRNQSSSQLRDLEDRINFKFNAEQNASIAALTLIRTKMDEIVESFKKETLINAEQMAEFSKDIEYLKRLVDLLSTKRTPISTRYDSDTGDETPMMEERSRHGTTISESSTSTKKRTPEISLEDDVPDDDDDPIIHPGKRLKRSNKPSMQKRHGVSMS